MTSGPTCYRETCEIPYGVAKCVCDAGWFLYDFRKHDCNGNGYDDEFCVNKATVITRENCINNGGHDFNSYCLCDANNQEQWCGGLPVIKELEARRMKSNVKTPGLFILFPTICFMLK